MKYPKLAKTPVPQSEPLNEKQVKNNAGGYVFQLDDWSRLDRFLILGSDSNTYYQKAPKLTRENTACVARCVELDYRRTVDQIVAVSVDGRAPRNDAAVFALALVTMSPDAPARGYALDNVQKVCRTSTHLFQFLACCDALGKGWGRAFKRTIANWYDNRPVDSVAYQAIKYRTRENWTHRDVLRLAHPIGGKEDVTRAALYNWICGKEGDTNQLPNQVRAHLLAMDFGPAYAHKNAPKDKGVFGEALKELVKDIDKTTAKRNFKDLYALIKEFNLPWEALPTEALNDPKIWKMMLPNMGLTALMRELGRMTQSEAIKPLDSDIKIIVDRLTNQEELRKARLHPFNLLVANRVYGRGAGFRGNRTWKPIAQIVDALEAAFYLAFKNIEPSNKRTLIGLDVSGSMSSPIMNSPVSCCEGATAMAMATIRSEKNYHVMAFNNGLEDLHLTANATLETALRKTSAVNFGGTDCSLPMIYATQNRLEVDVFAVYTDNETWAGRLHPVKALAEYRQKSGINAKLVVTGMTSTGFTIADPDDAGMLDVVGFDSNAPAIISDFARR